MQRPELNVSRTEEQRQKDLAALKKAKQLEAGQKKAGASYKRLDDRTYVLRND